MEQLSRNKIDGAKGLLTAGLLLLLAGMLFGVTGSFQYIVPGLFKQYLSFEKIRPLHVSSVVFWILFASTGSVLLYLREIKKDKVFGTPLIRFQFWLFVSVAVFVLTGYILGIFGGREYWEFPPFLALILAAGWVLFILQVAFTIKTLRHQPVYFWMWMTGAFGFLFTFSESYLWTLPYFSNDIVKDMTVQWKSYGSLVGSWNMLVYGLSIFLMEKISGDKSYAQSKMAFGLFFLGLFNLLFNWSHHIYTLPVHPNIRHVGYLVSMTELFILGRMIFKWKDSITAAQKHTFNISYRFLMIADVWVFINLIIAILISVPAINVYTHGTHITVAHVMGTTIGINTMLLMAVTYDLLADTCLSLDPYRNLIKRGSVVVNVSLAVFLTSLFLAGIERAKWQMSADRVPFGKMMKQLTPYLITFSVSGVLLAAGIGMIVYPILRNTIACLVSQKKELYKETRKPAIYKEQGYANQNFSV